MLAKAGKKDDAKILPEKHALYRVGAIMLMLFCVKFSMNFLGFPLTLVLFTTAILLMLGGGLGLVADVWGPAWATAWPATLRAFSRARCMARLVARRPHRATRLKKPNAVFFIIFLYSIYHLFSEFSIF